MKFLSTLLLLFALAHSNSEYELRLYEKILPVIFNQTTPLKIYPDAKSYEIISKSQIFRIVFACKDADILMGKSFDTIENECIHKPIFATSYNSFKNQENSFGTFYWRKGRPQIKFKYSTIKKYNLTLPAGLDKYAY